MADHRNDGPHLLPRPPRGRIVSRVQGIARLRQCPAGPMPFRRGKADLRKVSSTLLSAEPPRTSKDGHALCGTANALGTSNLKPVALAGWNTEGFLNEPVE